jgi:signal transduction histidine kinase
MPNGGSFTIESSLDEANDMVVFKFTDTGPGIPLAIRQNLYESFVTQGKENGTGLGLAIVKKVVDQHDGSIQFESELGKGTTFTIKLPRTQPAEK